MSMILPSLMNSSIYSSYPAILPLLKVMPHANLNIFKNKIMEVESFGSNKCAFVCDLTFSTFLAMKLETVLSSFFELLASRLDGNLVLSHSFSLQPVQQ